MTQSILVGKETKLPESSKSLTQFFEELLEKSKDELNNKTAVTDQKKKITFSQLNGVSNQIARCLIEMIEKSEVHPCLVAVRFEPDVDLIITLFAILKAGFAYLPIAPDWPKSRIEYLVEDANPSCVITNMDDLSVFPSGTKVINFQNLFEMSSSQNDSNLELKSENENIFAVMYTSGSTGLPKGVKLLSRGAFMRIHWQWSLLPYRSKDDVCAFKAALTFIDAVTEIFSALLSGHTLAVFPREVVKNVGKFVHMINEFKVSRLFLIPSLMKNMISFMMLEGFSLPHLIHWESTGEPLTIETGKSFFNFFHHVRDEKNTVLCNIYGGTEMMDNIYDVFSSVDEMIEKSLNGKIPSMGVAVENSIVYIMDQDLRPVPLGEVGEILIAGQGLASGYVGGHQHLKAFLDNPFIPEEVSEPSNFVRLYRTGDFGKIVDGRVFYEGRQDMQVKVRGQRVNLGEIERVLRGFEELLDVVVLVAKRGEANQTLVAFGKIDGNKDSVVTKKKVEERIKSSVPSSMVPKILIMEEDYPRLVNGKVDRQTLIKNFEQKVEQVEFNYSDEDLTKNGVSPEKISAAKVVLSTVGSVLGLLADEKPNVSENFFDIGGNSINAVFAVAKMNDIGYKISIEEFLQANSILDVINILFGDQTSTDEKDQGLGFKIRSLKLEDKDQVLKIFADTYHSQEVMAQCMDLSYEDAFSFGVAFWNEAETEMHLSLVAVDENDDVLAVMLGGNYHKETVHHSLPPKVQVIAEFVFTNELRVVQQLFPDADRNNGPHKLALEPLYLATSRSLSSKENLQIVNALEDACIVLAKEEGFKVIVGMNTGSVTQHVAVENGYQRLETIKVNSWTNGKGEKPFEKIPDSIITTIDGLWI